MSAAKYQEVVELFQSAIPEDDGAQLSVFVKGEQVINTSVGVDPDALINVFSCSKALSGIAFAQIVERGLIDLDETVVTYWPEFGVKGKSKITVRQLLSHQAGLPETRLGITNKQWLTDHDAANLLAAERHYGHQEKPSVITGYQLAHSSVNWHLKSREKQFKKILKRMFASPLALKLFLDYLNPSITESLLSFLERDLLQSY